MPMTGAERQRKYIEKFKAQNPEKYEERRKKHLEKVKQKQRKISDLIESEKIAQRQKWKEANNRRKEKEKQVVIQKKEEDIRRRREINAAKRALQLKAENKKLKQENEKLQEKMSSTMKRIVVMKKRLYRSNIYIERLKARNQRQGKDSQAEEKDHSEKKQSEKSTPMSKASSFIEEEVPSLREEDKEKVKRKVFELNVLSESLKQQYSNANTNKEKTILKKVVHNDLVKKYNLTGNLTTKLGLKGRVRNSQPKGTKENENIVKIKEFYVRDDVSRATAGRKECKTQNKNKQQKRFLLDSMQNLYEKYVSEGGKSSYTTFTRYRPFYVVNPTINDRDTCACIKHSNLTLKAKKLKALKIISTCNLTELVRQISCNSKCKECMYNICQFCKSKSFPLTQQSIAEDDVNTTWLEWGLKNHNYIKILKNGEQKTMTTKKVVKDVKTDTIGELIREFNKELRAFKTHFFNIGHQHNALQNCIKNLFHDEVVIICDFSENYSCKLYQEIQSVHFGGNRNQISLHTGVIYSKNNKPASFCSISPCCDHDPGAIWAHLSPVLEYIKQICPSLKVIHMFSDGPTTQYKQKKNFYLLSKIIEDSTFEYASWSFFEASHGKGAADGVGAAVKRTLDGLVSHGTDIPNADTAFVMLKKTEKLVKTFYISEENIKEMQQKIRDDLIALPGTMRVHQIITTSKEGSVLYRDLSCFCGTKKGYCKCYEPRTHDLLSTHKPSRKRNPNSASKNLKNKRERLMPSSDSEDYDSDIISYAESDDSTYCEEEDMLTEFLDTELEIYAGNAENMESIQVRTKKYLEMETERVKVFDTEKIELEMKPVGIEEQSIDKPDDGLKRRGTGDRKIEMDKIQVLYVKPSGLVKSKAEKLGLGPMVKDTQLKESDAEKLEIETARGLEITTGIAEALDVEHAQLAANDVGDLKTKIDFVEMMDVEVVQLAGSDAKNVETETTLVETIDVANTQLAAKDAGNLKIETAVVETIDIADGQLARNDAENLEIEMIDMADAQLAGSEAGNLEEEIVVESIDEMEMEIDEEKVTEAKYIDQQNENLPTHGSKSISGSCQVVKTPSISILSEIKVEMILNEKTGIIEIKPKEKVKAKPDIGKYVLVNFLSNRKKIYKYVCVIEDVSGERIIVKGLQSKNKNKTAFKTIENDLSIIERNDIVAYLPDPKKIGDDCIFETPINVKEV